MLHIALKADGGLEHVAVFSHVADTFTRRVLNIGEERAPVPIWARKAALIVGWGTHMVITSAKVIPRCPLVVLPGGTTTGPIAKGLMVIPKLSMGLFVPADTIDMRGPLDKVMGTIEPAQPGGHNVSHAHLSILVDAVGKAM
jgi:hypothetical protein